MHRVNHPGTKPKESIGAELAKSAIQASKTDSRSSPLSAPGMLHRSDGLDFLRTQQLTCRLNRYHTRILKRSIRGFSSLTLYLRDTLDTFLTHFSHFESVNSAKGDFCKQSSLRFEQVSKFTRIMMFEIPSGKQCQINRVDGLESSLYRTKVDALQIYPFKACYLVMLVPLYFDFSAILTADTKVEAIAAWKFSTLNNSGTNRKTTA